MSTPRPSDLGRDRPSRGRIGTRQAPGRRLQDGRPITNAAGRTDLRALRHGLKRHDVKRLKQTIGEGGF